MDDNEMNEDDMQEIMELPDGVIIDDGDEFDEDIGEYDLENEGEEFQGVEVDDSILSFDKHLQSVFCCAFNNVGTYAATGSEDDTAHLWDINNGDILLSAKHTDSVTNVGFNHDSTLLVTADMAGIIKVWDVTNKSLVIELETTDLNWLCWHDNANVLLGGTKDGSMWIWKIPSGECKHYPGHGQANSAGTLLSDGKKAVNGYEDGVVKVWDLRNMVPIHSFSGKNAHTGSVNCLDTNSDIIATGSVDSTSKLMNASTGKVLTTFSCGVDAIDDDPDSVETVALCKGLPILATATVKGYLSIWDLEKQIARFNFKQDSGIIKVLWDNSQSSNALLYSADLDGTIRLYDARAGSKQREWKGHASYILDFTISPDCKHILTAGNDASAKLYSTLSQT